VVAVIVVMMVKMMMVVVVVCGVVVRLRCGCGGEWGGSELAADRGGRV